MARPFRFHGRRRCCIRRHDLSVFCLFFFLFVPFFLRVVSLLQYALCVIPGLSSSSLSRRSYLPLPVQCPLVFASRLHGFVVPGLPCPHNSLFRLLSRSAFADPWLLYLPSCLSIRLSTRASRIYRLCMHVRLYLFLTSYLSFCHHTSNLCASPFKFYCCINHPVVPGWNECI